MKSTLEVQSFLMTVDNVTGKRLIKAKITAQGSSRISRGYLLPFLFLHAAISF